MLVTTRAPANAAVDHINNRGALSKNPAATTRHDRNKTNTKTKTTSTVALRISWLDAALHIMVGTATMTAKYATVTNSDK
jgi:hypothetical protein